MKARGTLVALLLPLALSLASLAACGGDSDSTATDPDASDSSTATDTASPSESAEPTESAEPSETAPLTPDWPACGDLWVVDAQLPLGYKGCLEGDQPVRADNLSCSSGQRIVRYDDRFFAVAGGTIYQASGPLDKDKQYLKMIRVCRA